MQDDVALRAFSALSNAARLSVLKLLVRAGTIGMTAGEIASAVEASPSRASFHLSALSEAGLVTSERSARQIVYRVDFQQVGALIRFLLHDCCQDSPQLRGCCCGGDNAAAKGC